MQHEMIDVGEARRRLLEQMLSGKAAASAAPKAQAPIGPREPARRVPLTAEQSQLWLHAQMAPEMPLYNEIDHHPSARPLRSSPRLERADGDRAPARDLAHALRRG